SGGPAVGTTYRRLADLEPRTLAVMHGSSYNGDCPSLLRNMADVYDERAMAVGAGVSPPAADVAVAGAR
ncbi:MAG: hypothetical protein M3R48_09510, partial [Candidatus Dormibacteraeota bacterium]|nr:hypothetical protein [Candidatus Dormibacteraeota bacterium]